MDTITIEWKHFDKNGTTCERCSQTGNNLQEAINELQKENDYEIEFIESKLTEDQMSDSNQIIINGKLIEDLIPNAKVGENFCSSCTDLTENSTDCHCRTLNQDGMVFEDIPTYLIKTAIQNIINSNPKPTMKIQVLGSGCPTCKTLYELTQAAVKELNLDAEVEYSTDISKIIEMGVMQSPVLALNGKPLMVGSGNLEKIKEVLIKGVSAVGSEEKPACGCGGKCC